MNSTDPLISVIIPIYNVEEYLADCLDSVLAQTYRNLDIILVDDGATDSSAAIAQPYTDDPRVRLFHKENGGLSSARNYGIEQAHGEYIYFLDSDDLLPNFALATLYQTQQETKADLVVGGLEGFAGAPAPHSPIPDTIDWNVWDQKRAITALYEKDSLVSLTVACGKLYRKEIFLELRFPEGKLHEDVAIALDVLVQCQKMAITSTALYWYRDNPNSITNTPDLRHLDGFSFYQYHLKVLKSRHLDFAYIPCLLATFKTGMSNLCQLWDSPDPAVNETKLQMKIVAKQIPLSSLNVKDRLVVSAYRVCPWLAVKLYSWALRIR